MPIGLDPLCLPAPCNLPAYDTSTNWRQQWSLNWPLLSLCCPPSFFLFFSTSRFVSAHISLAAAQSIWHHFYLPHYMCLPAPYLPMHTTALSHTHIHTVGLWFRGSYDTIQILLAAYSGEMCFAQSHFPQKSRFSPALRLWSTWHGGLVSTVLCFSWRARRTPKVSLTALCHCWGGLTTMWRCHPQYPKNLPRDSRHHEDTELHPCTYTYTQARTHRH